MTEFTIRCWNIRGLNHHNKKEAIKRYIGLHKCQVFAILESRIKHNNIDMVYKYFGSSCHINTNVNMSRNVRIILLWRAAKVVLKVTQKTDPFIHCWITDRDGQFASWVTFIYAENQAGLR